MRFDARKNIRPVRALLTLVLICGLGTAVQGQDPHGWQSLARLQAGDKIRLSLKTGIVKGAFESWTPEQVTIGTMTASKEDVLKIERYRPGAWGRGKKAAVGAAIGFGGGFAVGSAAGGCNQGSWCFFSREEVGVFLGGAGAVIGAGIGALLPSHTKELIYSAK